MRIGRCGVYVACPGLLIPTDTSVTNGSCLEKVSGKGERGSMGERIKEDSGEEWMERVGGRGAREMQKYRFRRSIRKKRGEKRY